MHSLNLGLFLVVVAEGILALARSSQLPLKAALKETFLSFQAFIRRNKIPCSQRAWTERALHLSGEVANYPWLKCKAYNSRVILAWLAVPKLQFTPFGHTWSFSYLERSVISWVCLNHTLRRLN